jgi:hypothetical protein
VSLRCTLYKHPVEEGLNFCPECRTGFVSQLECAECGRLVTRGHASCLPCARPASEPADSLGEVRWLDTACLACGSRQFSTPSGASCENGHGGEPGRVMGSWELQAHAAPRPQTSLVALQSPRHAPPALPGLPPHVSLPAPVATRHVSRQGGVEAEVRVPPGDAEVMDLMGQVVVVLHTFAAKVNTLTGHGELTRLIIRNARVLATDIQEELEQRKGPGR